MDKSGLVNVQNTLKRLFFTSMTIKKNNTTRKKRENEKVFHESSVLVRDLCVRVGAANRAGIGTVQSLFTTGSTKGNPFCRVTTQETIEDEHIIWWEGNQY